ncbi:hypothetical protein VTK56DRAFT_1686 [Thermocarpiscus australiensis]
MAQTRSKKQKDAPHDLLSLRRNDFTPEDDRTDSDLTVDQIQFADVIVLNKIGTLPKSLHVDAETKDRIIELITKVNRLTKQLESNYGKIDVKEIVNTGLFDMERA